MTKDQMVTKILDIIAPYRNFGENTPVQRSPIFEWGHETTPTLEEVTELAREIADAVSEDLPTCLPDRQAAQAGKP